MTMMNAPQSQQFSDRETRSLAIALAEMDEALTRSIDLGKKQLAEIRSTPNPNAELQRELAKVSWLQRWFARGLIRRLNQTVERLQPESADQPAQKMLQNLELLHERLRRLMQARNLERRDVQRLPFDSTQMNAVDAVASEDVPPGHVAEQLRPLYLWNGQVLRFAEVRVAKPPTSP